MCLSLPVKEALYISAKKETESLSLFVSVKEAWPWCLAVPGEEAWQ